MGNGISGTLIWQKDGNLRWSTPDVQTLEGSYCLTTTGTWHNEPIPVGKEPKAGETLALKCE